MALEREFLKACVVFLVFSFVHVSASDTVACVAVKEAYRNKGFDEDHVPISPISGIV